jgi:hypothetical protein
MPLLNVRLSPEDAAMAAALRRRGLEVSGIVRDAIRAKYLEGSRTRHERVAETLERIYAEHPDEEGGGVEHAVPHVLDRKAFRDHVRARLKRRPGR